MKTKSMYEIREWTGNEFSKPLSAKLKTREAAVRIVKRLNSRPYRQVFAVRIKIAA